MLPVSLVVFESWHAAELMARNEMGVTDCYFLEPAAAKVIEDRGNAFTLLANEEVVACGGTLPLWPGRNTAWMIFTPGAGRYMRRITRMVKRELDLTPGRVEMTVVKDYALGHRWARMLGFEVETPCLREYGPLREDHTGYVKLNGVE